jgi:Spy/CpxP family protein refolding chaperone
MNVKSFATLGLAAALAVGAALGLPAHAQPGHPGMGPGHGMGDMVGFLTKALDLTGEQKAAAQKIHDEIAAKAKSLMEKHHQQMEEVHTLLDGANPDPTEIGQKMIAAHATGEQLKALHEDAMARFSTVLTPEQLAKLKTIHEMHGEHHGFGPHDPGR